MSANLALLVVVEVRLAARKVSMFKGLLVCLSLAGLATEARASVGEAKRVVLIDTIQLTPALEKTNARARLLEVVAATVKQHGWEPLSGGDCHDLACASPAAATAGTPYALVLLGSFAAGQDYATDVGASLLRDGKAIARRTEEDEEAEFERSGVGGAFLKCGPPTGFCSAPLITSKLQQYAASLLDAESTAIRTRADAAAAVVTAPPRTVPPTAAAPKAPVAQQGGARSVVGWSLISAGMVLGGAAVGVWAYDNTGTDCHTECRMYQDTTRAALLTGLGALVTAGAGVAVLLLDRGPTRLALSVHPSGLALGGTF